MENEAGKQMTGALSAVRKMHSDCSRLLRDIDRELDGYRSVYASIATMDLSYDVKSGLYMAEGLLRHYVKGVSPTEVIAIKIAFFEPSIIEPLFIIAKIQYLSPLETAPDRNKAWDPWDAFLKWTPERKLEEPILLQGPLKKGLISNMALLAVPLFSIDGEMRAQAIVQRIRDYNFPEGKPLAL